MVRLAMFASRPSREPPPADMDERERLGLLECYDGAISELYLLNDRPLVDLIVRLERRWREAETELAGLDAVKSSAAA
jgi:hypothetical protein